MKLVIELADREAIRELPVRYLESKVVSFLILDAIAPIRLRHISMAYSRIALLVIGVAPLAQASPVAATLAPVAAPSAVAAVPVCNRKFKGGLEPSPAELAEILKQHAAWLKDGGRDNPKLADDPRRANLCGADLHGAALVKAKLGGADLEYADLHGGT